MDWQRNSPTLNNVREKEQITIVFFVIVELQAQLLFYEVVFIVSTQMNQNFDLELIKWNLSTL